MVHIVQDHPFVDGNKRAGYLAAVTFLSSFGLSLTLTEDETIDVSLTLAQGGMTKNELAHVISENIADVGTGPLFDAPD